MAWPEKHTVCRGEVEEGSMLRAPRVSLLASLVAAVAIIATPADRAFAEETTVAVGPQYGTTHVYVSPEDVDRLAKSFVATFGGSSTRPIVATVTPTPSGTISVILRTPVGLISLFGFKTPIPFPFGAERTGYLVTDIDRAVEAARKAGAAVLVAPFSDAIGRDTIIQWPGGVNMQLYWHTIKPSSPPLEKVPENRVYISPDQVDAFIKGFTEFSGGKVISDDVRAPGAEIGRPNDTYRRVRIESLFGNAMIFVTDGHLPFPYGRELTGYEVADLAATLDKVKAAGVTVLVEPQVFPDRTSAMVEFPGGYVAEVHSMAKQ
ncbi:glyoxalase [Hyphomicrobium sp. 802]|uniref:glyoxalase n=1 Tax=Hyphomicrobium sp. 802 TaxID=1112272 RepID=UPI0004B9F5DA|nr:glyoxalase [Hyphomicrobium sp. 802]